MKSTAILLTLVGACLCAVTPAHAGATIFVTVTGEVEFNLIRDGEINRSIVTAGSPALLTFQLDAGDYLDSTMYPVRGYAINQASYQLTLNGVQVGMQNPYPAGETPYFVIRDNDPAVDGFFLSSNIDTFAPEGLPTDEPGIFGQFYNNFYVTYLGSTLPSLDIMDALGAYDFTDLTVFNWTMDDGVFGPNAMGIVFEQMTITPEPASLALLALAGLALIRRKR